MISLRVSEEEYEALKALYRSSGARSLSEFARLAMHHILGEPPADGDGMESRMQELQGRLALLDRQVTRLAQLVEINDFSGESR